MKKYLLITALAFLLSACAASSSTPALSPAATVFAAKTSYEAVLITAVAYNKLPRCGTPKSPPLCSDQAVVVQLRKADDAALATLGSAENIVRTPGVTKDAISFATVAATNAVSAMQAILSTYNVK